MNRVLRSPSFWIPFAVSAVLSAVFFAWELGYMRELLPSVVRPSVLPWELAFTGTLGFLLSVNAGLAVWQSRYGHCPVGVRRVSGIAGLVGAFTLICPACILLPASLIGVGFFFASLGPYLPMLRIASVILLLAATWMLRPRKN